MTRASIRVLIVDDHPVVRFGLSHSLADEVGIDVVGEAADAAEALEKFRSLAPDVIVLDLELGKSHGVEALRAIREVAPASAVIIYTSFADAERVSEAAGLGFQGYLTKEADAEELAKTIRTVYAGGTVLDPLVASKLMAKMHGGGEPAAPARDRKQLTEREREILSELMTGRSNRDIAKRLFISERTVKFHITSIFGKLRAKNRTEAVLKAAQEGITGMVAGAGAK
jgi:DNA-binding NarL/FixJ family response regulator